MAGETETDRMMARARQVLQSPSDNIKSRERIIRAERRTRLIADVIEIGLAIIIGLAFISWLFRG